MTGEIQNRPPQSSALFDELLVVMAQRRERRGIERLYQRWNARLLRTAQRYTGDKELARDLVQECWIAIYRKIGTLRDPARFAAFAFTILHRRGADHLRRVLREHATSQPMDDGEAAPAQEDSAALREAFAELPADQRIAAHLFFVEQLTLQEIADVQGIAIGTAKTRIFHARRKLKAALSPLPQGENP
jgi:RNA polymerase sigma-70 factor (ECF subfamily)